jgi:hypothetical protein
MNVRILEWTGDECHPSGQPRPRVNEHVVQFGARGGQRLVEHDGTGRRVVQEQHHVCEQSVSPAKIHDAAAAKEPPDAARDFPRLVQLLAWQTSRVTDGSRQAIEERIRRKAIEVAIGQTSVGRS